MEQEDRRQEFEREQKLQRQANDRDLNKTVVLDTLRKGNLVRKIHVTCLRPYSTSRKAKRSKKRAKNPKARVRWWRRRLPTNTNSTIHSWIVHRKIDNIRCAARRSSEHHHVDHF